MKNLCKAGLVLLSAILILSACTSKLERTKTELSNLLYSLEEKYVPDPELELWMLEIKEEDGGLILEGALASKAIHMAVISAVDEDFPEIRVDVKLLPEGEDGRFVNGLVNNSVTHLRKKPSSRTEMVTQALLGMPVRILMEAQGKRLIQVPDGYLGWVNANEVHFLEAEELARYKEAHKIVYNQQYGFAYSEPDQASMPVGDLVLGCLLPVLSEQGDFYQVEYPDERIAWVIKSEVIAAEDVFFNDPQAPEVCALAMKFNGVPYLWGGTSTKNIDCSGLVSNVYFMNGIQLPRDADPQAKCGREITTAFTAEQLEAGDLLFFGRKATEQSEESVTHVGLYIGGGEFIHSAGYRDRVSINSMDSSQTHYIETYPEIFVRATRIIGEETIGFLPIAENAYYKEIINAAK